MLKRFLLVIPMVVLLFILGNNANAFATTDEFVSNESQDVEQQFIQVDGNQENENNINKKFKIETAFINCKGEKDKAICNWDLKIKGDYFVYNGIKIHVQKDHGWLSGGWKDRTSHKLQGSSEVKHLHDQHTFKLGKGKYRARLGDTFITGTNGTFQPIGYD